MVGQLKKLVRALGVPCFPTLHRNMFSRSRSLTDWVYVCEVGIKFENGLYLLGCDRYALGLRGSSHAIQGAELGERAVVKRS